MRAIFACLVLVAVAQAADWANLRPMTRIKPVYRKAPNPSGRIIGGEIASKGQFKYQVAVVTDEYGFCGGSLIAHDVILTAAHCIDGGSSWEIHAGALNISEVSEAGRVIVTSRDAIMHEDYDVINIENDIAIVKLSKPICGPNIRTVRLPSRSQAANQFVGAPARVSGWGWPDDNSFALSERLKFADVVVMDITECQSYYGDTINVHMLCVDTDGGTSGPCGGDSGGPLVITEDDGLPTEVGIVSFGIGAGCTVGFPEVFTRVTEYLDWLETNAAVTIRP